MEDGVHPKAALADALLKRCVSIDLEIDPKTNRIHSFAGVCGDDQGSHAFNRGNLADALRAHDRFSESS